MTFNSKAPMSLLCCRSGELSFMATGPPRRDGDGRLIGDRRDATVREGDSGLTQQVLGLVLGEPVT